MTGFIPGIATSSLADGGSVSGGEIIAVMNAKIITNPTTSIDTTQTHSETSPYKRQNLRGLAVLSKSFNPLLLLTIKITPKTLVAFHLSSTPFLSQFLSRMYQTRIKRKIKVQSIWIDPQLAAMSSPIGSLLSTLTNIEQTSKGAD
jgi:hypothetical protein